MRSVLVAAAAMILMGCPNAGPAIPALPGQGGPAWTEVTSAHFVMWTDAPSARAKDLITRMEHHRLATLKALDNHQDSAKIFVIALRDADEVGAFVPKEFAAYAMPYGNAARRPTIVLAADTGEDQEERATLTHELTHVVTFSFLPNQPPWFAEGMAEFFATAKFYGATTVELGRPLAHTQQALRSGHMTPMADVFACHSHECMDSKFYATSWALFAYLVNNHLHELLAYVERLAVLPRGATAPTWAEVAPALPPELLDHAVAEWLAHGSIGTPRYEIEAATWPTTERPITDGDVLATRALLRASFDREHDPAAAQQAIDAALAADKTNVLARMVQFQVAHAVPADEARATAAAHPDDWRAWWLLGYTLQQGPEAIEAHDKLCALATGDPLVDVPPAFCGHRAPI